MTDGVRAYIGVGANLGDPLRYVRAGIAALQRLADSDFVACSSLYRTAPIGVAEQPDFVNAVCALDTRLVPEALWRQLSAVEMRHGRIRGPVRGGPRTLDLDILLYGDLYVASSQLTIPHPRLHQRAFVLAPLREIAPDLRILGGESVSTYLSRCDTQAVVRIDGVEALSR